MRILLLLFLSAMIISSCSNDKKSIKDNNEIKEDISPRPELIIEEGYEIKEIERSLATERALAKTKISTFLRMGIKSSSILAGQTYDIDYKMIVNKESGDNEIVNENISFKNNLSYTWNAEDSLYQSGTYIYNDSTSVLLLLSNQSLLFPSEWTVKNSGNVIILVGTSTFRNNNTQIHMVGRDM